MFKKHVTESFSLANKNLEIYLIGIFILIAQTIIARFNSLLSFLTIFIVFGFYASIPLLIDLKDKTKVFNAKQVFTISVKNSRRLTVPIILFICILLLLAFSLIFFLGAKTTQEMFSSSLARGKLILTAIFFVLTIPFEFTSIYFSIENMGVLKSMRKSFWYSLKNPRALILITLFWAVNLIFRIGILPHYSDEIENFISGVITQYFGLLIASYTLLIYRKKLSF